MGLLSYYHCVGHNKIQHQYFMFYHISGAIFYSCNQNLLVGSKAALIMDHIDSFMTLY